MINESYIQKKNWNLAEMSGRQILTYINRKRFKMLKERSELVHIGMKIRGWMILPRMPEMALLWV